MAEQTPESNSTGTSSSSQSQSVPSSASMDSAGTATTLPTQDVVDGMSDEEEHKISRGACGEVRLAFSKGSCQKYAVKIISKKTFSVRPRQAALRDEVEILKRLHHPCVIRIEDVYERTVELYHLLF
ncbi:hypothetical protein ACROYT_G010780 [Oculina patagonica]